MTSFTVMAHPVRRVFAESLRLQLGARIVYDEQQSRWDTGRRAWLLHDAEASHHAVIQDDAVLSKHFRVSLEQAISRVPDSPIVLYAGNVAPWRRQFETVPANTSFLVGQRIIWGVGIVIPTHMISSVITYGDELTPTQLRTLKGNYDLRLSKYFEASRLAVYYTWPALVDHRGLPSLVPGRNGGRHAYNFAGDRQLDWSGPVVRIVERSRSRRV